MPIRDHAVNSPKLETEWVDFIRIASTTVLKVLDLEPDPRSLINTPETENRVDGFYQIRFAAMQQK
jgi:hypothetical protein